MTRAHSNSNPTTARILPTAGHRPIPSDKPTLLPPRQTLPLATPLPLPSRLPRRLRTTHRSQRIHDTVLRLHPLLVQPHLPHRSPSEHRGNQHVPRSNQETAQLRKSLPHNRILSLFRHSHILPRKLLRRHDTPRSHISAGLMGSHVHRHSRLRHLRRRVRHIPVL